MDNEIKQNQSNKKNIVKISIGIVTALFLTIGVSYAFWLLSLSQNDKNTIGTACLKLTLTESNDAISLKDSFPISDFEGMQTEEYTFTVKNDCNRDIDYRIDLDSLLLDEDETVDSSKRLSSSSVAVLLDYGSNFIDNNEIPTYADLESIETTDTTLKDKKVLAYDTVLANSTNTHTLRMWVDESSEYMDESKDFEAKVSIFAGQGIEKGYTDASCFTFDSSTGTITDYDATTCGTDVVIPYEIDDVAVTTIGKDAFENKSLTSVEIPRSVTTIAKYGFEKNQSLTKLILKDGLTSIGDSAFDNGTSTYISKHLGYVHNLIIPSTVTTIESHAFEKVGLQRLIIPDNVTSIGWWSFRGNVIKELLIGSGITKLDDLTFANNSIENLVIPDTITEICVQVFGANPLKSITIGSGVTSIDNEAFYSPSVTNKYYPGTVPDVINVPSNVININGAFNEIPTTTKIIFNNCESDLIIGAEGNSGGTQSFICETE